MNHAEAAFSRAVERYLLGEMTGEVAESFERHFFQCALCSAELSSGALLAENMRAISPLEPATTGIDLQIEI